MQLIGKGNRKRPLITLCKIPLEARCIIIFYSKLISSEHTYTLPISDGVMVDFQRRLFTYSKKSRRQHLKCRPLGRTEMTSGDNKGATLSLACHNSNAFFAEKKKRAVFAYLIRVLSFILFYFICRIFSLCLV